MKHTVTRTLALVFALMLMLTAFTGCAKQDDGLAELAAQAIQDRNDLQAQLTAAQTELAALKAAPAPEAETVEVEVEKLVPAEYAIGVDCTLNGADRVMLEGKTDIAAVATPAEGYKFDHWTVNGEPAEGGAEATFSAENNTTFRAVCVPEHTLTCVNCHFQFTNDKGSAKGDNYTEFNFEEDYVNPVTGETVPGGKITGVVTADIPKGYEVEAWLINGVAYEPNSSVKSFLVTELDEQTVYEVRLIKSTEKKYTVTCKGCTFSGGGYSNATSGKVKSGTKITVTGGLEGWWSGSGKSGYAPYQSSAHTQGYTVKSNCSFTWQSQIN